MSIIQLGVCAMKKLDFFLLFLFSRKREKKYKVNIEYEWWMRESEKALSCCIIFIFFQCQGLFVDDKRRRRRQIYMLITIEYIFWFFPPSISLSLLLFLLSTLIDRKQDLRRDFCVYVSEQNP